MLPGRGPECFESGVTANALVCEKVSNNIKRERRQATKSIHYLACMLVDLASLLCLTSLSFAVRHQTARGRLRPGPEISASQVDWPRRAILLNAVILRCRIRSTALPARNSQRNRQQTGMNALQRCVTVGNLRMSYAAANEGLLCATFARGRIAKLVVASVACCSSELLSDSRTRRRPSSVSVGSVPLSAAVFIVPRHA